MVISGLHVRAVRVPMSTPHRTASGVVSESPLVLCDVLTDEGIVGHSVTFTYSVAALKPTADLIANLGPLIEGKMLAPVELGRMLAARFRLLGTHGLVGMAIAAIEMAAWDAHARSHGLGLARLLGGVERPLQAYGAVGYDGAAESAKVAEDWARRGFRGVKAKVGYPTVKKDVEVIRAIRSALGPNAAIMVDYNQCLTPAEAIERMRVLDDEGLTWVEEPTMAHDHRGHALIAGAARTPVQCGENWWSPLDLQHALEAGASDYVMPEVMKIGGVSEWLKAAALAEAAAVPVSSHLWPEISAHLLCLTPMAHWLEYADWWNPVLKEPLRVEKGMAIIDGVMGTGVEWDEAAVARFAA
jgi:mandelate racemase